MAQSDGMEREVTSSSASQSMVGVLADSNKKARWLRAFQDGGRYWARTSDPLLVREVLSQLS